MFFVFVVHGLPLHVHSAHGEWRVNRCKLIKMYTQYTLGNIHSYISCDTYSNSFFDNRETEKQRKYIARHVGLPFFVLFLFNFLHFFFLLRTAIVLYFSRNCFVSMFGVVVVVFEFLVYPSSVDVSFFSHSFHSISTYLTFNFFICWTPWVREWRVVCW